MIGTHTDNNCYMYIISIISNNVLTSCVGGTIIIVTLSVKEGCSVRKVKGHVT